MREETTIVHSGLHPERHQGAVNPPVFHASTILSQSVEEYRRKRDFSRTPEPRGGEGMAGAAAARAGTVTVPVTGRQAGARSPGRGRS